MAKVSQVFAESDGRFERVELRRAFERKVYVGQRRATSRLSFVWCRRFPAVLPRRGGVRRGFSRESPPGKRSGGSTSSEASIQGGKSSGPNALVTSSPAARRRETGTVTVAAEPDPEPVDAHPRRPFRGRTRFLRLRVRIVRAVRVGASFEMLPTTAFPPNVPAVVARMTEHLYARLDDAPICSRPVRRRSNRGRIGQDCARVETGRGCRRRFSLARRQRVRRRRGVALPLLRASVARAFEHADVVKVVDSMSLAVPPTRISSTSYCSNTSLRARAAVTHVAALFKWCCDEAQRRSPSACAGAVARIVASLAACLFPEAEGAPTRRRAAFVGALVGVHGSFIDAYEGDATIRAASASAARVRVRIRRADDRPVLLRRRIGTVSSNRRSVVVGVHRRGDDDERDEHG